MPQGLLRGCDEGPESRLAEMDSGRKNRGGVYRVRDQQHGPGPAPSRHRVVSGQRSTCIESRCIVLEDADMVIDPAIRIAAAHPLARGPAVETIPVGTPQNRSDNEDAHYAGNAQFLKGFFVLRTEGSNLAPSGAGQSVSSLRALTEALCHLPRAVRQRRNLTALVAPAST